jgi:branched-chain amino acid transport system substrate-binding protein
VPALEPGASNESLAHEEARMATRAAHQSTRGIRTILYGLAALVLAGTAGVALAQEEFKYGAVSPVTGPIPQFGEYFIRGSQLALEDLEKSGWIGGKKIRIILEDGKNDPKISLAAMNKLISVDKVPIVETVGSSVVLALGPVAQQNGVILTNTAAQNPNIRKIGHFIFSLVPLADRVMQVTAVHAVQGMKAKTAVMLYVNNEYGRGVAETFKKLFEEHGGKIVGHEIHAQGETDFTTPLTKIKFANPDILFFVGHDNELGYALKKAKQIAMKTPWLVAPGVFTPLSLSIAGDAAEGVQAADYNFDPVAGTERMKVFGKRHQDKYGVLPTFATAHSYNSVTLYAAALKGGARTPAEIRDYFLSVKNFDGMAGPLTFDKDGITTEQPVMKVIRGGKFVLLK